MTLSAQEIQETSNHYRQRVSQSQRDYNDIRQLQSMAQILANSQHNQKLADPARYHRSHGGEEIMGGNKPGSFDHWASNYLQALNEPSFDQFHRALTKLAQQTADPDGRHSEQNVTTFTAAASYLVKLAIGTSNDQSTDGLVSFTLGLTRSAPMGTYSQTAMTTLITAAFHNAVKKLIELTLETQKRRDFHRMDIDDLGRTQYRTATLTALNRANRLANLAVDLKLLGATDADLAKLREISSTNLAQWTEQSVRDCAFDAISTNHVHYMAEPLDLTPQTVQDIANVAREIFHRHQDTNQPKAHWLNAIAADQNPADMDDSEQSELCQKLDKIIRQYNEWNDSTLNFDDYGQPKDTDFRRLDTLHDEQNLLHSSIVIAASRITAAPIIDRRNTIMVATAGNINWQSREEFDAYAKHASATDENRAQALERLNDAFSIINAMPAQIVPNDHKKIIMNHDQERRNQIRELIG